MPPASTTDAERSSAPAVVVVLTTLDERTDAAVFARTLVEARVAACVNVLPPMQSVYRWKGVVETATERQLVIKTTVAQVQALTAMLSQLHPYDVPEMLVLPVTETTTGYRNWLVDAIG